MFERTKPVAFIRVTLAGGVVLFAATWAMAQQPASQSSSNKSLPEPTIDEKRNDTGVDFGSREFETRTRLILKAEKKAHQEHLERAREASDLAAELQKTYETNRLFNAADFKKLDRLEKLTRRIRNEVGGSQADGDPKELPKTIEEAVPLLATMAKELSEQVENTPRRVISTLIIDQANKLISLIQYVRGPRN